MSDNNSLYEITRIIEDENIVKNDMVEIMSAIKNIFYKKYINKFESALVEQQKLLQERSPKEIELLKALKPFASEGINPSLDKIIELLYTINTASNIHIALQKNKPSTPTVIEEPIDVGTTIHSDGIYELDNKCSVLNSHTPQLSGIELIFMCLLVKNNPSFFESVKSNQTM